MTARTDSKRQAKDVEDPRDATKVELVAATLALIGGDTRYVVLDELALACHRLAPAVFSWPEYTWLPSLDSVRVTLVDVRRAGLIDEASQARGRTLKGMRLSEAGRQWAGRNAKLLEELRSRLPDAARYEARDKSELVAVAAISVMEQDSSLTLTRTRLVAEAYRLFPAAFSLAGYPGWPDTAAVDAAVESSALVSFDGNSVVLRKDARSSIEGVRRHVLVKSSEGFGAAARRQTKGMAHKAVDAIERSALFRAYQKDHASARIEDEDVCDILSVTLEASPETVKKHLDSMSRLVEQAERWDLVEFMRWIRSWCEQRGFRLLAE